jgi:hypothetical protein
MEQTAKEQRSYESFQSFNTAYEIKVNSTFEERQKKPPSGRKWLLIQIKKED